MHEIDDVMIGNVIITLKELDVRGFDSMNRLVSLVMLFENILQSEPSNPPKGDDK